MGLRVTCALKYVNYTFKKTRFEKKVKCRVSEEGENVLGWN